MSNINECFFHVKVDHVNFSVVITKVILLFKQVNIILSANNVS